MSARATRALVSVGLVAGVIAVLAMLAPWARSGRVDRSSVDLLSTAGSLDVIEGATRLIAVVAWAVVPMLVAGAIVSAAWGRNRAMAAFLAPVGPILAAGWWVVADADVFRLRWGAPMSAGAGLTATLAAFLILMTSNTAETRGGEQ